MQQRAVETRNALLDAALDCLIERGYAATTTIETARRAGVSRGAQQHHFPTKAELMAAAVGRLLERRADEYRKAFADVPPGSVPVHEAIDLLWSMMSGPTFTIWAELWMASRTDSELAEVMLRVDRQFAAEAREIFLESFPEEASTFGLEFALALMDGLAFQRLVDRDDQAPVTDFLNVLKMLATHSEEDR